MNDCSVSDVYGSRRWRVNMQALAKIATVLAIALVPMRGAAQQVVSGAVLEGVSGAPLAGAQVAVTGTRLRALTNAEGRFRIEGVTGTTVTLRVTTLGYSPRTQTVQVDAPDIRLTLERAAVSLENVVVTATGEQRLREMGSAIGRVRADSVASTAPISNLGELLGARVAGVEVQTFSGTSVGRSEIRIRGVSSLSLANGPLVYVDGVRVNAGPSMPLSNNSNVPTRMNDINVDEIQSIDVLKGPSAATLYGTEAARGVILITTKRGKTAGNKTEWHAWGEAGRITEPNRYPAVYSGVTATGAACLLTSIAAGQCTQAEVRSFNMVHDPRTRFFKTGKRTVFGGNVGANLGAGNYFLSSEIESQTGVYEMFGDGVDRVNLRGNFTIQPSKLFTVDVSTGYVSSKLQLFREGGTLLGPMINALRAAPRPDGWFSFTPQQLAELDHVQAVERFIGGTTMQLRPTNWMNIRGVFGLDATSSDDQRLIPPGVLTGARAPGIVEAARIQTLKYTNEVVAGFEFSPTDVISSRSSIGGQFFRDISRDLISTGTGLAPVSNSISSAAQVVTLEGTAENRSLGTFVSHQLGYKDRLFVTAGVRTDNNSSFGERFRFIAYPNVNGSWVISDEPFFPTSTLFNSLRLRAGWGKSGSAPGPADAVQFLRAFPATTSGGQDQIGVSYEGGRAFAGTGGSLGNPSLKPERASEVEGGIDVGFLQERITGSLTFYNKSTSDALVFRPVGPSVGATAGRWENLGKTRNRGIEATLDASVLERDNTSLRLAASFARNQNKLIELSGIQATGSQRNVVGYPLSGYWDRTLISFVDSNNDGIIASSEVTVSDTAVFLGEIFPPVQATIQPTLTLFNRVRTSGLLDIRTGHKLRNNTESDRCANAVSRSRNDKTTPLDEQARCIASVFRSAPGGWVESADFTRLRELSFTLFVPKPWAEVARVADATITLAGQNLAVWSKYSGIDPEPMIRRGFVVAVGRAELANSDFYQEAPVRTWILRANLTF